MVQNSNSEMLNALKIVLKKLREATGYPQSVIANLLGISRSTYSYYETGNTTPSIDTLKALADLYAVSLDVFFDLEYASHLKGKKNRSKNIPLPNPQKIGELTINEKHLIAHLRRSGTEKENRWIAFLLSNQIYES